MTLEFLYCPRLDRPWQTNGVWQLLCDADGEFVPPLSARESTCQAGFSEDGAPRQPLPRSYFAALREQSFLLAAEGERVVGFLSFREGYLPPFLAQQGVAADLPLYISTILVAPPYRRQGITRRFYQMLFSLFPQPGCLVSTRTWSGNHSHIALLRELRFQGPLVLPDDRGPGIDTEYYYRSSPKEGAL